MFEVNKNNGYFLAAKILFTKCEYILNNIYNRTRFVKKSV